MPPIARPEPCILIKTSPEIALKTHYVRKYFMNKLAKNLKSALRAKGLSGNRMVKGGGRIFLYAKKGKAEKIARLLPCVFGIHSFAIAEACKTTGLGEIVCFVANRAAKTLKTKDSFAIRGNVAADKPYSSKDLENAAGSAVLEIMEKAGKPASVNLTKPKKEIFVEVREREFFIYSGQKKGAGGLPLGCEGNVGVLFEGRRKEPLAALLVMRRGCNVFPLVKGNCRKTPAGINRLARWNLWRGYKLTPLREIGELISKPDISIRALVLADEKPRAGLRAFPPGLPLLYPLAFYPKELMKEKLEAMG